MNRIKVADCLAFASQHKSISLAAIIGPDRTRNVSAARHLGMWLARRFTPASLQTVTTKFGRDNHTTVGSAMKTIQRKCAACPEFAATIAATENAFLEFAAAAAKRRAAAIVASASLIVTAPATAQPETAP